jgi:hypothetical protein
MIVNDEMGWAWMPAEHWPGIGMDNYNSVMTVGLWAKTQTFQDLLIIKQQY